MRIFEASRRGAKRMWRAWQLDAYTWTWIAWIVLFIVAEAMAVQDRYQHTLTAHLRPVFLSQPWTWWAGTGLVLAFWIHVFVPAFEKWFIDLVGRGAP